MAISNNWGGIYLEDSPVTEGNLNRVFNHPTETNNMNNGDLTLKDIDQVSMIAQPFSIISGHNTSNLTDPQKYLIQALLKDNGMELLGKQFKLISTYNGLVPAKMYQGVLTAVIAVNGQLKNIIFELHLEDNSTYKASIYQLEPLFAWKLKKPTAKQMAEYEKNVKNKVVLDAIGRLNRQINNSLIGVKDSLAGRRRDFKSYSEAVEAQRKEIERLEAQIAIKTVKDFTLKDIEQEIESIKRNKKIADAYISVNGNLIIITNMLYALDIEGKENKDIEMGRYVFKTPLTGRDIRAFGLDYKCGSDGSVHWHPNIMGSGICWGENALEMNNISNSGQLYELADLLIVFFSLNPHDGGSPYIDFESWMEERTKVTMKNALLRAYILDNLEKPLSKPSEIYEQLMRGFREAKHDEIEKHKGNLGQEGTSVITGAFNPILTTAEPQPMTRDALTRRLTSLYEEEDED